MIRAFRVFIFAIFVVSIVSAQDLPQTRGLHPLEANVPGVGQVRYAVSVPDGYRASVPTPLVLVLHPGGQRALPDAATGMMGQD